MMLPIMMAAMTGHLRGESQPWDPGGLGKRQEHALAVVLVHALVPRGESFFDIIEGIARSDQRAHSKDGGHEGGDASERGEQDALEKERP